MVFISPNSSVLLALGLLTYSLVTFTNHFQFNEVLPKSLYPKKAFKMRGDEVYLYSFYINYFILRFHVFSQVKQKRRPIQTAVAAVLNMKQRQ